MTASEIVIVAASAGVLVGAAVFLLMARRLRGRLPAARAGGLTPEQIRDISDLTEQLERLIQDIDGKIADHLSRIEAAVAEAEAKTTQLRQAAACSGPARGFLEEPPYSGTTNEDEPVTLPGTWPVPPSRPQTAVPNATPRNASQLQSPRHAEVLGLHNQGLAAPDIARKLRMDIGEVELVLRLHGAGTGPC